MLSLSNPDKAVLIAFAKLKKDVYFKSILDYLQLNRLKLSKESETTAGEMETFKMLGGAHILREFLDKITNSEQSLERLKTNTGR